MGDENAVPFDAARDQLAALEVCRLSAEALGKHPMREGWKPVGAVGPSMECFLIDDSVWNPLVNPEQRWACVKWLLERYPVTLGMKNRNNWVGMPIAVSLDCPAAEFPARAVAELRRRKLGTP